MKGLKQFKGKKYIQGLFIAAFLALSVMTANSIRMGDRKKDADEGVEETLSRAGQEKESRLPAGDADRSEERKQEDNESEASSDDREDEETPDQSGRDRSVSEDREKDREEDNSAGQNDNDRGTEEKYHYNGKTKLTWPVSGHVILPYSMDTTVYYSTLDQYATNDGVLLAARKGDEVKAAADGKIVDIADTDRYGLIVTMMIGDYYEIFYGQLEDVRFEIGDHVKEGDVLGRIAEPTRSFLLEGPHLYLKMTRKGESVNPTDYLR